MEADIMNMPFADGEVDLLLSFSGLQMLAEPNQAIAEIGRCPKPGGRSSARPSSPARAFARALFRAGACRGHALPPERTSPDGLRPPAWSTSTSDPSGVHVLRGETAELTG
jgi:SAM-dependent methyltransferase